MITATETVEIEIAGKKVIFNQWSLVNAILSRVATGGMSATVFLNRSDGGTNLMQVNDAITKGVNAFAVFKVDNIFEIGENYPADILNLVTTDTMPALMRAVTQLGSLKGVL